MSQLTNKTSEASLEVRDLKIYSQVESHTLVMCEDQTDAKRLGRHKRTGLATTKMRKKIKSGDFFECEKMSNEKVRRVKHCCPKYAAQMNSRHYW